MTRIGHILAFRSNLKSEEIVWVWSVMRYNYYLKNNSVKITEAKEEEAGEGGRETVEGGKIIFEI